MQQVLRNNLILCFGYAISGWLALQLAVPPGYAAPLFPPAGIALAALLIKGPQCLPGIFLGSLLVQLAATESSGIGNYYWLTLSAVPFGAALQAWIGYRLTRSLIGLPQSLDSLGNILRFVGLIAPVSCLISAGIAVPALLWTGSFQSTDIFFTWANWWAGDTIGVLIMTPVILAFLGEPASAWRPRRQAVAVPMSVALALLLVTFSLISHWENRSLRAQFEQDAQHAASLISHRMDSQLDQIQALERLLTIHPQITREQWREFVTPLLETHPGTQNFGWSPLIRDSDRNRFEAQVREKEHFPDYRILGRNKLGQTYPLEQRSEYLPILYVEPLERNRSVLGLDPLVLEQTAEAAQRTRQEHAPVASRSIKLVQERGNQRGVVVYQAVFDMGTSRQLGMISSVFRMDDAIYATLAGHHWEDIEICLTEFQPEGGLQRLFGPAGCENADWYTTRMHAERQIRFAGQTWMLHTAATAQYMKTHRGWGVWLTLLFGPLIIGILGAFLLMTSGRARRIEQLVEERTQQLADTGRDLERQHEELLQAQRIARLGSWESYAGQKEIRCSSELRHLLGLPEDNEISEDAFLGALHPEDRPALASALKLVAAEIGSRTLDCRVNQPNLDAAVLHFRLESDEHAGNLRIRGTAQDVTLARAAEAHIAYLAHFDVLTGLPNRTQFNGRAQAELAAASRYGDLLALLFLDLDQFKAVNDSLGHQAGDQLLKVASDRLSLCLRKHDFIARLGGDEFVILLPRLLHQEDAAQVARKLLKQLQHPVDIDGNELTISVSIGIALYPADGNDLGTLLKHADMAMYGAKERGRNNFHFFESEMDLRARERLMLENSLRRAIDRDELLLHYQPQVSADGHPLGCEALVRWQHPELGMLPPIQFIGIAEACGLIVPLGEWVLRTACRQQATWAAAGYTMTVAVNISALQFRQPDFADTVRRILDETGANPAMIELELTESALMLPTPDLLDRMHRLREWGLPLALDDFGTGYSSLSYLKRLPIHRLKLDRSFVTDLPENQEDAAIASATLSLARNLGMEVVAEGVETEAQQAFLRQRGCAVLQGYLFSRPLPAGDLTQWWSTQKARLSPAASKGSHS